MTITDAFHVRVMLLALENLEDSANRLEYDSGREFVQAQIRRLREEIRIYDKRAKKSRAA